MKPFSIIDGSVYHHDRLVTPCDHKSFTPLLGNWAKDNKRVYNGTMVRKGINPDTFTALNYMYATDGETIYLPAGKIKADPKSFQPLDSGIHHTDTDLSPISMIGGYGKDRDTVFFENKPIKSADVESFQSLGNLFAKDANNAYHEDSKVPAKCLKTWTPINSSHSIDQHGVYYNNKQIPKADPTTFYPLFGYNFTKIGLARDADNYFVGLKIVTKEEFLRFCEEHHKHKECMISNFKKPDFFPLKMKSSSLFGQRIEP